MAFDSDSLRDDLSIGFFGGAIVARRAAPLLLLWLVGGSLWHLVSPGSSTGWATIVGGPVLVLSGYLLAAFAFGLTLHLLRPLSRWWLGYLLSGYVLAFVVYGAVGAVAALGYQLFGLNLMRFESVPDAWHSIPLISAILGFVGIGVAAVMWSEDHPKR